MGIAANKPDAMSRIPFAERYARECGSVPAGTPYPVAANDGAARKRPPIKIIPTAIRVDRTKPMCVATYLLLVGAAHFTQLPTSALQRSRPLLWGHHSRVNALRPRP